VISIPIFKTGVTQNHEPVRTTLSITWAVFEEIRAGWNNDKAQADRDIWPVAIMKIL